MVKLVLLVAVIVLGIDALVYDGSYTQAAWNEISIVIDDIRNNRADERPA